MNLDLPRQPLSIQSRANKYFGKLNRSSALEFDERILIDDVCHLFFLLLPLRDLFLQVRYLFRNGVETMAIGGPVSDRPDESSIRVLKGLWLEVRTTPVRRKNLESHRVFLLPGDLAWCLEIDAKKCLVTLIALADVLDRVDMERDGKTVDRQNNG